MNKSKSKMTPKTKLKIASAMGVGIVSIAAFSLSFEALTDMALTYGVSSKTAWLLPLALDLSILIFSLALTMRRFDQVTANVEKWLVIGVTAASVILNGAHGAQYGIAGILIHALPPLLMAASVETIIRMISAGNDRKEALKKERKAQPKAASETKLKVLKKSA